MPAVHPYLAPPRPRLFAHRGASDEAPENTLPAFERALALGATYLETDARVTGDGEVVLLHDEELERTTDGSGRVGDLDLGRLRELDAGWHFSPDGGRSHPFRGGGVRVPRLAELLSAHPGARVNVEVKGEDPPRADAVVDEIRRLRAQDRVLLTSASDGVMARIRALDPGTAIGASLGDVVAFVRATVEGRLDAFEPAGHALQLPLRFADRPLVTAECVAAAHRVGLEVHVWTVNDPGTMRELLELGVDGLMSDRVGLLLRTAR